jgi:hypothetical protein
MNGISFSLYDALNKLIIGAIALSPLISIEEINWHPLSFTVAAFLCGLFLWLILALITEKLNFLKSCWLFGSNNLEIIERTFKKIKKIYSDYPPLFKNDRKKCYLGAYYRVQQAGLLGNIPTLEALSEFFKNLLIAILPIICCLICDKIPAENYCFAINWYVILGIIAMSVLGRHYTETKIHYLVWEADYFLMHNSKPNKYERKITKKGSYNHSHGCNVAVINTSIASSSVRL